MLDLLMKRRSIRRYQNRPVEPEKIDILMKAALLSPSSRNLRPWEFILVTDKEMLEKLSRCKPHGASFLKEAPLAVVVLGDPQVCDVWVEDTSIASILIQMTAQSLGLGSCWIQIRKREYDDQRMAEAYIRDLLQIPQGKAVESIIAIGYPDEDRLPHREEELRKEKVYHGVYGTPYSFS